MTLDQFARIAGLAQFALTGLMVLLLYSWRGGEWTGSERRRIAELIATVARLDSDHKVIRQRIHDLVTFWEVRFVGKELAEAKWGDFQGQINRATDDLKQLRNDLDRRGKVH